MTAQTKRLLILVTIAVVTVAALSVLWLARGEPGTERPIPTASSVMVLESDVPLPQQCKTAPRSTSSLLALLAQSTPVAATPMASATPVPAVLPDGRPADPSVVAAIVSTYLEATACSNAGDFVRALSLYSDDNVQGIIHSASVATGLEPQLIAMALSTPITTVQTAQLTAIVSIDDVQHLSDGRVAARIGTKPAGEAANSSTDSSVVVFARQGDRWLIDEIIWAPGIATPAPVSATP